MDLSGNTGVNDPNSLWGSGLLSTVEGYTQDASGLYTAASPLVTAISGQTPIKAPSSSAPGLSGTPIAAPSLTSGYMPWLIGGAVVLLGWLLLRGK